jgi:plastocyanin
MTIKTFIFRPHTLTVAAGTTVRFVNDDAILHTVTSGTRTQTTTHPDGRFDARLDGKGSTYSHTFSRPGTYPLYCSIHPGMTATVVVR